MREQSKDAAKTAATASAKASDAWDKERDSNEPTAVRGFRKSLLQCACVGQLFDPWFMDSNTLDQKAPEPNQQRGDENSNERLHSHHLHITVNESKIL